ELLQLTEVAEQAGLRVGLAVHALVGGEGLLEVGPRVADGALAVGHVAEGVVDDVQLRRRTARLYVLHVVRAVVDTPLHEVPDHLVPARRRLYRRVGRGQGERDSTGDQQGRRT